MARPARGTTAKKKPVAFEFSMTPVSVVTPLATTHFICLAEENEVSGNFGGTLLFTDADLDQEVTFKEWGKDGDKWTEGFFDGVDSLIEEALEEYNVAHKKPAQRADKFKVHSLEDGTETELWEFSIKNKDQPKVVDKYKQRIKDFDELVGNGSTIKVQVNLKPYFMQGKVGVTAYFDYVLIKEIKEYGGGGGGNPFDDDDFEEDGCDIPAEDEQEEYEEPAKPARKRKAKAPEPEPEEEEEEPVEEEAPAEKPKRKRRTKAEIEAEKAEETVEDEPETEEEAPKTKSTRTRRSPKKDTPPPAEEVEEEEAPAPKRARRTRAKPAPENDAPGEDDDF